MMKVIKETVVIATTRFQVWQAGLRICRSCCLEPPSRAHSSPVHTCNT